MSTFFRLDNWKSNTAGNSNPGMELVGGKYTITLIIVTLL